MLAVILFPFLGIYKIASNTKPCLLFMMQCYVALSHVPACFVGV